MKMRRFIRDTSGSALAITGLALAMILASAALGRTGGFKVVPRILRAAFHRLCLTVCACLLAIPLASADLHAASESPVTSESEAVPEYLVKAAMLYHFARFTKWPKGIFTDSDAPFRICVLGQDPFGSDLDALVSYQIRGRDIVTTRLRSERHAKECHLLFIAKSEEKRLQSILKVLGERSILTIADMDKFARLGGIIHLKIADETIRFEINIAFAQQIGLKFSSDMLMLASIITGEITRDKFGVPTE